MVHKTVKKGDLLHDADRICTHSYFIHAGLLRTYFLKEGKEVSEYFSTAGEWVNSPRSFIQQRKDIYYTDALENSTVSGLHVKDLVYLFDHFPEMERYARLSMGTVFGHLLERITSLRFTSAKDKYEHFVQVYHDTHHRIPLGMIATWVMPR